MTKIFQIKERKGNNHQSLRTCHCAKGHTGCNDGCKNLTLEQGVCPQCREKTLVMIGSCRKCPKQEILLNFRNPDHMFLFNKRECPVCRQPLAHDNSCKTCQKKVIVLYPGSEIISQCCDSRIIISQGICLKCERTLFFMYGQPLKICPTCKQDLDKKNFCGKCKLNITFLAARMGWCQEFLKYDYQKRGKSELLAKGESLPMCIFHKDFDPAPEQKQLSSKFMKMIKV